jgi:hypothetical protein
MAAFDDHYKVLQVNHEAEATTIKWVYFKLAQIYSPDNPVTGNHEKMVKMNLAWEVLGNPDTRRKYDIVWKEYYGAKSTSQAYNKESTSRIQVLTIEPDGIVFKDVEPHRKLCASFVVFSKGGQYSPIRLAVPNNSWIKKVNRRSISVTEELPMEIEIEVEGNEWDKIYLGNISIFMNNSRVKDVPVTLKMMGRVTITDHKWHDLSVDDFPELLSSEIFSLSKGEDRRGHYFDYRLSKDGKYFQYRLQDDFKVMAFPPRLIADHDWHYVDIEDLPRWITNTIDDLAAGEIKKGNYFDYQGQVKSWLFMFAQNSSIY